MAKPVTKIIPCTKLMDPEASSLSFGWIKYPFPGDDFPRMQTLMAFTRLRISLDDLEIPADGVILRIRAFVRPAAARATSRMQMRGLRRVVQLGIATPPLRFEHLFGNMDDDGTHNFQAISSGDISISYTPNDSYSYEVHILSGSGDFGDPNQGESDIADAIEVTYSL